MSRYQVALLRGAVVYLLATAALGVVFTVRPGLVAVLGPTHAHLGLVGFFLSTVMGVAFWMLPRPGGIRQRGWEAACFYQLNAGLVLRTVAEPWWRLTAAPLPHVLFVTSGGLVLAAVCCFAWAMRSRLVTFEVVRARSRGRGGSGRGETPR